MNVRPPFWKRVYLRILSVFSNIINKSLIFLLLQFFKAFHIFIYFSKSPISLSIRFQFPYLLIDIDECQFNNGGCQQICLNRIGNTAACICRKGYVQHPSSKKRCQGNLERCCGRVLILISHFMVMQHMPIKPILPSDIKTR